MQKLSDGQIVLSATDLTNHLACGYLTQSNLGFVRGEVKRPQPATSPHADLLRRRGDDHEQRHLERLSAEAGGDVADLKREKYDEEGKWIPESRASLQGAADRTEVEMRKGTRLIFQAHFFDGTWQGNADFLRRVDLSDVPPAPADPGAVDPHRATREAIEKSTLGDYAYEVLDTKLSKHVKPAVVHQLLIYSRLAGRIQGTELPIARVILGDDAVEDVDLTKYGALHRRVVRRFQETVAAPTLAGSCPEPVAHCAICALATYCEEQLRGVDHLSFVAGVDRRHRGVLVEANVPTLAELATADYPWPKPVADDNTPWRAPLEMPRFAVHQTQARLQVATRDTDLPQRQHRDPEAELGYARLPVPSRSDLFFDFEGDPYEGPEGIEYLWGWSETKAAGGAYHHLWAHDAEAERAALERFIDEVHRRLKDDPWMHVYHYAHIERTTLEKLAIRYGTRESEMDDLLRRGVFVDLFTVVRQAVQLGEESYSLKRLERHYGFERKQTSVRSGGGSVAVYEDWLMTKQPQLLQDILEYNAEDCRSTEALRDWLWHDLIPEVEAEKGVSIEALRGEGVKPKPVSDPPAFVPELERLAGLLREGLAADATKDSPRQHERRLTADLLMYHYRESKPDWWEYFRLTEKVGVEDYWKEREALGPLAPDPATPPYKVKQSTAYSFTFPPQEFKGGNTAIDAASGGAVDIVAFDADAGRITLKLGAKAYAEKPHPRGLIAGKPFDGGAMREAIKVFAEALLADRVAGAESAPVAGAPAAGGYGTLAAAPAAGGYGTFAADRATATGDRYTAVRRLLARDAPRFTRDVTLGESTDELSAAALALDESVLPVQGPPGTGKTYNGARMIVAALRANKRVGITSGSHAALRNLVAEVERVAIDQGVSFQGGVQLTTDGDPFPAITDWIISASSSDLEDPNLDLVAGTSWVFSRPAFRDDPVDLLFIDEAGQFSLANAVAVGLAAKSIVLLGDPKQLPQVTKVTHPGGAGDSVLEYLLGESGLVEAGRGVLLRESWRMHPEVCEFVSNHSYAGELRWSQDCESRRVDAPAGGLMGAGGAGPKCAALTGAGLRTIEVDHEGNSQQSPEEAEAIAEACEALLDGSATVTGPYGPEREVITRPLVADDILVVAPYNLAVNTIQRAVPASVRVGTVDKFQGQEAPIVFFALTCSSAEDVPRGLDFLFDPNRFNVAISRAECLAVLVHAPRLLDADCKTPDAMRRVDGACELVEESATSTPTFAEREPPCHHGQ